MPLFEPKKIIVRMPNWLGDAVRATPILEDLRNQWKEAEITAMCQSNLTGLIKADPNIDEILSFQKPKGLLPRIYQEDTIEPLQRGKYDLGILLTNSLSSAWWFWRGQVKRRIGFAANLRSPLLTDAVPYPKAMESQDLVQTYKALLTPLGIPLSNTFPHLYVTEEEQLAAKQLLEKYEIGEDNLIIGVNPGSAYGPARCWPPERFKEVTLRLIKNPRVRVVYFGDQSGAALVHQICTDLPKSVVNLAGKTNMRELIALIQRCTLLLTNDSGPMHLANALGTPQVALFGSTCDVRAGPYNNRTKVIHKHVECSPCYKRVCPIDFRCMKRIEVEEVYNEIEKLLH
jgi:heptosyltransferase II